MYNANLNGLCMKDDLESLRQLINELARVDEVDRVNDLLAHYLSLEMDIAAVKQVARGYVQKLHAARNHSTGVNQLMQEYSLSTPEGVALMCLAESLLRIPDSHTRNELIRDKLGQADWAAHLGNSTSMFVNAGAWGLFIAGRWVQMPNDNTLYSILQRLLARGSEGLIRRSVELAVKLMGQQFVVAETIEEALVNCQEKTSQGYTYSFDMLGEAAVCDADAQAYFDSYAHAIQIIGAANPRGVQAGHGISVKLSALHPRYTLWQEQRVHEELYPRLYKLALSARQLNMAFNIDAEESERLDLSLDLFTRLAFEPGLSNWNGLGLAVQAYQTRATAVINYIALLARSSARIIQVRLVKGAYWDSEIKRCQVQGLAHFPVFTRKVHTDLSYLCCAEILLRNVDCIYPQFATHNAHTYAAVQHMAARLQIKNFEMQCLYGMGEGLYSSCRIYAPVGSHHTLLPYLVRRLLENGSNTSFVNQITNPRVNLDSLLEHPVSTLNRLGVESNPACTPAPLMFGPNRLNSRGIDLHCKQTIHDLTAAVRCGVTEHRQPPYSSKAHVIEALRSVGHSNSSVLDRWVNDPKYRASSLIRAAELLEQHHFQLIRLLVFEAGKTIPNAHAEIRESVDFCRYYAAELLTLATTDAERQHRIAACISPWNFPLAIFTGQVMGALASGHSVVAKPAEQTPLVAGYATELFHLAGVPQTALQIVYGDAQVGAWLTQSPVVDTVLFTGSNSAAKCIEGNLLRRDDAQLPALLVSETGGLNAMVVDSSALLEQVVADVLESAFGSAGQRCSALRLLCVHSSLANTLLPLLKAAMLELQIGDPSLLCSDIGPLIDQDAWHAVNTHIEHMKVLGLPVFQGGRIDGVLQKNFMAPTLIELQCLSELKHEVFGPVLHVLQFESSELPALLNSLNSTGYALTFGIHSRIQSTVEMGCNNIQAGNVYVNRNMVGAVVGSQPFGGHGRSGTGPKAGGPLYLPTLMRLPANSIPQSQALPGPTGEQNLHRLQPRGRVWCTAHHEESLRVQIEAVLAAGNVAVVESGAVQPWACTGVQWIEQIDLEQVDAAVCELVPNLANSVAQTLATCASRIIPLILANSDGSFPAYRLVNEQLVCTNTSAAGGNTELISKA